MTYSWLPIRSLGDLLVVKHTHTHRPRTRRAFVVMPEEHCCKFGRGTKACIGGRRFRNV